MQIHYRMTRHGCDRSTGRDIPPGIAEMIVVYGESWRARDGAMKHGLSRDSMANLRRDYGPEILKSLEHYRKRGAFVVTAADQIITVAFAGKPFFK